MPNYFTKSGDRGQTPKQRSSHEESGPRQSKQSPDDFRYEGDITEVEPVGAPWSVDADDASTDAVDEYGESAGDYGDEADVTIDSPDDFE